MRLIGGCCGTTPKHIAAIARALADRTPVCKKDVKQRHTIVVQEAEQTKRAFPCRHRSHTAVDYRRARSTEKARLNNIFRRSKSVKRSTH
ncbi:homocysteine S-methyltransferase family protein [Anoxybacillus sp. KU2-6(11)]|uniref:homocysteine S-methyltransferase family protein n=1 Tax=Anoxybacillus sp. KU2-6(11) TaxID=1535751 RepID=UPI000A51D837